MFWCQTQHLTRYTLKFRHNQFDFCITYNDVDVPISCLKLDTELLPAANLSVYTC